MFKLLAVLAFVATCSARYYGTDSYYVDIGYNYIKVSNGYGNQVNFFVDQFYGYDGPQAIQVLFQGQDVTPKTVQYVDQQSAVGGRFQSDILYQIFNDYTGPLDEIEYEKLLNLISTYVQNGQVNPAVLYALQALFGQYEALSYFDQGLQTPFNKLGFLYGQGYTPYAVSGAYSKVSPYGVGSFYPTVGSYYPRVGSYYPGWSSYSTGRYGSSYLPSFFGSYSRPYSSQSYLSRFSYPQNFYESYYGPYANYGYQYGISGAGYPQQYFGGYYGPYAGNSVLNLFRGYGSYGSNLRYQWPIYNY